MAQFVCLSVLAHARSAIFRLQLQYFVSITNLQDMLDNLDFNVFSRFYDLLSFFGELNVKSYILFIS